MKKLLRGISLILVIFMIASALSSCSGLPSINLNDLIALSTGEAGTSSGVVVEGTGEGTYDMDAMTYVETETDIETETVIYVNGEELTEQENVVSEFVTEDNFSEETQIIIPESYPWWGAEYVILSGFELDADGEYSPNYDITTGIHERNAEMMTRYGLNVFGDLTDDVYLVANTRLLAGDANFDLIIGDANDMMKLAAEGHLADINTLDYVDMNRSGWNEKANYQLSIGEKLYYTTNKFLIHEKMYTNVLWYNRELANELMIGDLEQEVLDGTWTFESFLTVSREASGDLDGLPEMTMYDRWGIAAGNANGLMPIVYGSDFFITEKDEDGYLGVAPLNDKMFTVVDRVKELYSAQNISFIASTNLNNETEMRYASEVFEEGRALFLSDNLNYNLAMLKFEHGILPMPKYDLDQESYASITEFANARFFGVPVGAIDIEKAAFGLEALTEISENTSYRVFIETVNVNNDFVVEECLDEILDNRVFDIVAIRGIGSVFSCVRKEVMGNNLEPFQVEYERRSEVAQQRLDSLNKSLRELN